MTAHRNIVAGIGEHDVVSVLRWVVAVARPGDQVRLVHAFEPLPYATMDWQLPVANEGLIYAAAARRTADAARWLRANRHDLGVVGEILRREPDLGLADAAVTAGLVILGTPHRSGSLTLLSRLGRPGGCPVLVVGDEAPMLIPHGGPVMVLLRASAAEAAVLDVAFAEAAARRSPLVVLRPWHPVGDIGLVTAETEEQKGLDALLSGWCEQYPSVAVSTELRLGDAASVIRRYAMQAPLLVLGNRGGPALEPVVADALHTRHRPSLLVAPRGEAATSPDTGDGGGEPGGAEPTRFEPAWYSGVRESIRPIAERHRLQAGLTSYSPAGL